jgi:CRP-like cAMP-binding protein
VGRGKHFQARALDNVEALVFEGAEVLEACRQDASFGFAFMVRLLDVVSKRLQATRVQLVDMHSPVARQAGI